MLPMHRALLALIRVIDRLSFLIYSFLLQLTFRSVIIPQYGGPDLVHLLCNNPPCNLRKCLNLMFLSRSGKLTMAYCMCELLLNILLLTDKTFLKLLNWFQLHDHLLLLLGWPVFLSYDYLLCLK